MRNEIKNARIKSTMLGDEDHGIFTFNIHLDYGDSEQGFGGYALGGEYTNFVIKGILKTVGVESWEDLKGKFVRAKIEDGRIVEIGHMLNEVWFNPRIK